MDKSITLFVATDGNDGNPGTMDRPFATLEGAQNVIRNWKKERQWPQEGITVYIRKGIYELKHTFELSEADSGKEGAPVAYRAFENEAVDLRGGTALDPKKFKPVADTQILDRLPEEARPFILQYDLKGDGIYDYGTMKPRGFRRPYVTTPMELFFENQPMTIARWPNEGEVAIGEVIDSGSVPREKDYSNRGGAFRYDYDRADRWKEADDIWLCGYFAAGYADDTVQVKSIDREEKIIHTVQPHMYGYKSENKWSKYYVMNLLEEIDRPGEYYIDRTTGVLYFWPPEPIKEGNKISVSLLETPLITIENTSHIRIQGLTLELGRGIGIYIEEGEAHCISNCTIRNMGMQGICIGKGIKPDTMYRHNFTGEPISRELGSWHEHIYDNPAYNRMAGRNHMVEHCHIYNIGAGAISMGGGDRKTLTPAHNAVFNCEIHDFNQWDKTYKAGVNIDGVGNRIAHCLIYNASGSAVYLHGNDHTIEYNEIHHACLEADDMGAIYMGRDPSERGNVIKHNYIHHVPTPHAPEVPMKDGMGTFGVYVDDGACGTVVEGNVFYKAGSWTVLNNGGSDIRVLNNIIIQSTVAIFHSNSQQNKYSEKELPEAGSDLAIRVLEHINITGSLYSEKYPALKEFFKDAGRPSRNIAANNIVFQCPNFLLMRYKEDYIVPEEEKAWYEQEGNLVTWEDPGFVDMEQQNWALKQEGKAMKKIPGFVEIPFHEIGLLFNHDLK